MGAQHPAGGRAALFDHFPHPARRLKPSHVGKAEESTRSVYARLGGLGSAEVIMWLVMCGALSAQVNKIHQSYYLPTVAGPATAIYEDQSVTMLRTARTIFDGVVYAHANYRSRQRKLS